MKHVHTQKTEFCRDLIGYLVTKKDKDEVCLKQIQLVTWTEFTQARLVPLVDSCQRGIESKKWISWPCSMVIVTEVMSLSVIWVGKEITCVNSADKYVT